MTTPAAPPMTPANSFGRLSADLDSTASNLSTPSFAKTTNGDHAVPKSVPGNTPASPPASAVNGSTGPPLHHRSCVTCRRRKVRCDKRLPCSNCSKANIECVFPNPGRAPRKARKPPDTELLARLRRLEGVVRSLGKDVDAEGDVEERRPDVKREEPGTRSDIHGVETRSDKQDTFGPGSGCPVIGNEASRLEKDFGRLVIEEGRSRYVSNSFWASLSDEVAEMKDILDPVSDDDDYPSPEGSGSSQYANHQGFIFNFSSTMVNLRVLHPPPIQIYNMWQLYMENVEPLVKIFHIPSMCNVMTSACSNLDNLPKGTEALMFAIYLSVATSLSPGDCRLILGEDKEAALSKYKFATEQALARAGFLNTQERVVLEAFVLFLVCVRRQDDTRFVWTLTGLSIRIAQSLGLHRDGTHFGLKPFETEMRRRLWWQVVILDIRAAEDQGTEPSITEDAFDTKLPLNVNDADLDPEALVAPEERVGSTELTFCLMRYEVSHTMRLLTWRPSGPNLCRERILGGASLEDKERMIEQCHRHLEEKYLQYCDMTVPLYWVTATVARLIMSKMWLIVHHPFKRADGGAKLPQETKDRLFVTSVEVIEFSRLLKTEKSTMKWGWLFRTYVQWHAVAYILSELCTRTRGEGVDRAWNAIDAVFADWGGVIMASKRGMLWKPLRMLVAKARTARARELEKDTQFPKDGTLGPVYPTSTSSLSRSDLELSIPDVTAYTRIFPPSLINNTAMSADVNGASNSMDSVAEPPQTQQIQLNVDQVNQWMSNEAALLQDPLGDETLDWAGWDDMVKDFQMEVQQEQGMERGPVLGGMTSWW